MSREFKSEDTLIGANGRRIGGEQIQIFAGPCAVESREVLQEIAETLSPLGVQFLRGGAFKPRTSPYSFQGWGEKGLKFLAAVRERTGMLVVTELMDPRDTVLVCKYADIVQIGTRNMQNFRLLTEVGNIDKPVILKRGMCATIKEFLMSAEYILAQGNDKVILCERGIRTFETETRNTLDISAIPLLKQLTHLPVIVDPSHAVGRADLVSAVSKAAIAAGADGLLVEVPRAAGRSHERRAAVSPPGSFCDHDGRMPPRRRGRGDARFEIVLRWRGATARRCSRPFFNAGPSPFPRETGETPASAGGEQ